jgi:putative ABC transport system permease protein
VLTLYAVRFRRRWVAELMAVVGIAAGVALLYAASVASTSLSAPVHSLTDGLVGNSQLQLVSRGSAGMPEQTAEQIAGFPGVRRVAPVLQLPGNLVGPRGDHGMMLFGADPRIVQLRGDLLQGLTGADAARQETIIVPSPVARALGVRFGDDVRVEIAGRTVTVPVAVAGRDQIGPLVDTSIALFPLRYLQRLAGVGSQVSRILVEAEPGQVTQVRRRLQSVGSGGLDVRPAEFESRLFENAAKPVDQATLAFSVLSAVVGFLFAMCALLVTAGDRRKMAAQQRALGVPPRARVVTLLVDAAVVGIAGAAVGLVAGELLSRAGFSSDVSFLSGAFPIGDQRMVTWQSVAIAGAGGLVAAMVGVLVPLRDVVRDSLPRRRRRREGAARVDDARRWRLGSPLSAIALALLGIAAAITFLAPAAVMVGLVVLGLALVLVLPAVLAATISALAWWNRRTPLSSNAAELALQHLKTSRWRPRALAITATGAVAVFGATALQGARVNLQAGLDAVTNGMVETADVWAAPRGAGSSIGIVTFPPDAAQRLARLPAVAGVGLYRAGLLDLAGRRAWVIGQPSDVEDPIPPHQVLEGDAARAARDIQRGGWASVSRALADDLGLHVGRRFTLATPKPVSLRVAAITTNFGWASGAVVLSADDFARAWGGSAIAAYQLRLRSGTSASVGRREVAAALGPRSALRVETGAQRGDRQRAISRTNLARLRAITTVTLIAAILAMGAAMTGLLWQHRPLVRRLKVHGPPTGFIWRMLFIETGVLFGVGAFAGGIFGLLGQVLGTKGVQAVTGFPAVESLRLDVAATTIAVVVGASLLVVAVPGFLVAGVRPSWRG